MHFKVIINHYIHLYKIHVGSAKCHVLVEWSQKWWNEIRSNHLLSQAECQVGEYLVDETGRKMKLNYAHGTTTLGFKFKGGAVLAVDSRATSGQYIGEAQWLVTGCLLLGICVNGYLITLPHWCLAWKKDMLVTVTKALDRIVTPFLCTDRLG